MKTSLLSAFAITIALVTSASAQPAPKVEAKPVAAKVQTGSYAVDPDHTQITFAVSHIGLSAYRGRLENASGTLKLDPANLAATSFDVTVPTDSINTPSAKLNDELKSADWLDAKTFPQITFKSKSVAVTGPKTAKVTGDLTLHGVTRPVTLNAVLYGSGENPLNKKYTVGFELDGQIKRSDFGVKTYLPMIGDAVDLTISAAFEKQ